MGSAKKAAKLNQRNTKLKEEAIGFCYSLLVEKRMVQEHEVEVVNL